MSGQAPTGPGPLIWIPILAAVFSGAYWGPPAAIGVFVGVTLILLLIANALEKATRSAQEKRLQQIRDEYRRKFGEDLPPLTDELRGVFDGMMGRKPSASTPARAPNHGSEPRLATHLPQRLVPPAGHSLAGSVALADLDRAMSAESDTGPRIEIFLTRCFDYAMHCDAREWGPRQARERASHFFSGNLSARSLAELQDIADEAVRLGYRAATPLDLSVILGKKADDSWQPELQRLVGRGQNCARAG